MTLQVSYPLCVWIDNIWFIPTVQNVYLFRIYTYNDVNSKDCFKFIMNC